MTVNTEGNRITYEGNGSTTTFTFPFPAVSTSYIAVVITNELGQIPVLPSQFTVVMNAPIDPNPTSVGGSVTYPISGPPLPVGSRISIIRSLPRIQQVSLSNQSIIYPPVIEKEFDYLTMISQQGEDILSRAFVVPLGDPLPHPVPTVSLRAGHFALWSPTGELTAGDPAGLGVPISAAMQPVVAAATIPDARVLLGLGPMATFGIGLGLQDDGANKVRVNVGIQSIATNQTITQAFHNSVATTNGILNFILGATTTYFNGFGFYVNVISGRVTFTVPPGDMIQGLPSGTGWTIIAGTYAFIQTDGAGRWYFRYFQAPQATSLTIGGGAGNFAVPLGATRLLVQMCAGGGGGGASGAGGSPGGVGGNTSFGGWSCIGGTAGNVGVGQAGGGPVFGGTGGANGPGTQLLRVAGGGGGTGLPALTPETAPGVISGFGGGSFFGDGGGTTFSTNSAQDTVTPGGGGGGAGNSNGLFGTGGGGGGGEYVSFIMNVVGLATIAYNIGAGGSAAGGAVGRGGIIFVTATYDQGPGA